MGLEMPGVNIVRAHKAHLLGAGLRQLFSAEFGETLFQDLVSEMDMKMKISTDFSDYSRRHNEHTDISGHFVEVPQKCNVEEICNFSRHAVKIRQDVEGWCESPARVWK